MGSFIGRREEKLREILECEKAILARMEECPAIYATSDTDRQRVAVLRVELEILDEGDDRDD